MCLCGGISFGYSAPAPPQRSSGESGSQQNTPCDEHGLFLSTRIRSFSQLGSAEVMKRNSLDDCETPFLASRKAARTRLALAAKSDVRSWLDRLPPPPSPHADTESSLQSPQCVLQHLNQEDNDSAAGREGGGEEDGMSAFPAPSLASSAAARSRSSSPSKLSDNTYRARNLVLASIAVDTPLSIPASQAWKKIQERWKEGLTDARQEEIHRAAQEWHESCLQLLRVMTAAETEWIEGIVSMIKAIKPKRLRHVLAGRRMRPPTSHSYCVLVAAC